MKTLLKPLTILLLVLAPFLFAEVMVTNVSVKPRWPWNGKVDITYSIECDEVDEEDNPKDIYIDFKGHDKVRNREIFMNSLTGTGATAPVKAGGPYTVTWNAAQDYPNAGVAEFSVDIHAATEPLYLVIDLTTWKHRLTGRGPFLGDDKCRTTELWLRRIPAGTFMMGSSPEETFKNTDFEDYHQVTISKPFYIGVFEVTQKQWALIKGNDTPRSPYYSGETRPRDIVSYNDIRGSSSNAGGGWPQYGHSVDSSSFLGVLRQKTGLCFDLPTDAQWEYACRAGTQTSLNINGGVNLANWDKDDNMDLAGRYMYNRNDGKGGYSEHTKVGSYLPNNWGLYDMHGNVYEWVLDRHQNHLGTNAQTDPVGPSSGSMRFLRGGNWNGSTDCSSAALCRSAYRGTSSSPSYRFAYYGFRVVYLP